MNKFRKKKRRILLLQKLVYFFPEDTDLFSWKMQLQLSCNPVYFLKSTMRWHQNYDLVNLTLTLRPPDTLPTSNCMIWRILSLVLSALSVFKTLTLPVNFSLNKVQCLIFSVGHSLGQTFRWHDFWPWHYESWWPLQRSVCFTRPSVVLNELEFFQVCFVYGEKRNMTKYSTWIQRDCEKNSVIPNQITLFKYIYHAGINLRIITVTEQRIFSQKYFPAPWPTWNYGVRLHNIWIASNMF